MWISVIFGLIFSLIIVLIFVWYEYALALFIAYFILVPIVKFPAAINIPIGSKFVFLLFFGVFVYNHKDKLYSINYKPFTPFLVFYGAFGILIVFQGFTYLGENVIFLFNNVISCVLFPIVIYGTIVFHPRSSKWIGLALLGSGTIFIIYGIFLTQMPGFNPYLSVSLPIFGETFNTAYALGYSGLSNITDGPVAEGRMFGRISSVFRHPMTYALNLGLFAFFIVNFLKDKKLLRAVYIIIIVIAILVSGVRTPILAMALTVLMIVIYRGNLKYASVMAISIVVLAILLPMISDDLYNYVGTVFGGKKQNVAGSSLSMRIEQFVACFDVLSDNLFQGNGYNWVNIYLDQHEIHPKLLAFESLVFVVLCNTGLIGVFIWTYLIVKVTEYCNTVKNTKIKLTLICLGAYYLLFSCITGEYGYMLYFMIYFAFFAGIYESKMRTIKICSFVK